jgi:hypothetical protein
MIARMRYRKLRIAWSVVWGLAAVLMIALWVRSYRGYDVVYRQTKTTRTVLSSAAGIIGLSKRNLEAIPEWGWSKIELMPGTIPRAWGFSSGNNGTSLRFPHRLPIAVFSVLAAAPWIRELRWRFSLRTLLIATTLIAVVLGLIVWMLGR